LIAFVDGVFGDNPVVSARDAGFLSGDGLFETLRVAGGRAFRLAAHVERLRAGLDLCGIPAPAALADLDAIVAELSARNARAECLARVTLSRGVQADLEGRDGGGGPTLAVHLRALAKAPAGAGARVVVAEGARGAPRSPTIKSISFQPLLLARRAALATGATEALLLDSGGCVIEGTCSNVFWVHQGILHTPALELGPLPGVTRRFVLRDAAEQGIGACEVRHELARLRAADEAFLTSAGIGVLPIALLEGRPIGDRCPGPISARLGARFEAELARFRAASAARGAP